LFREKQKQDQNQEQKQKQRQRTEVSALQEGGKTLAVERPTSRKGREKWGTPSLETVLDVDYSDQFFHGGGALVEGCFLFRRQFNFDNLLDSLGSELYWNADV